MSNFKKERPEWKPIQVLMAGLDHEIKLRGGHDMARRRAQARATLATQALVSYCERYDATIEVQKGKLVFVYSDLEAPKEQPGNIFGRLQKFFMKPKPDTFAREDF